MGERIAWRHREATAADLPAIVAIYNATIPSRLVTSDLEPVSVASRRAWFEAHSTATRPICVVEDGGHGIVAWLSFSDFYGRPAYRHTSEVSVYVAESHRRRGIARGLIADAIRLAPSLDIATLLGFIFAHNSPSLALFAAFGFVTWGRLPRVAELDGIERDVLLLGRRVDTP